MLEIGGGVISAWGEDVDGVFLDAVIDGLEFFAGSEEVGDEPGGDSADEDEEIDTEGSFGDARGVEEKNQWGDDEERAVDGALGDFFPPGGEARAVEGE